MNVVGMPTIFMQGGSSITRKKVPTELANVFQGLMQNMTLETKSNSNVSQEIIPENTEKLLSELLGELPPELKDQLILSLKKNEQIDEVLEGLNLEEALVQQLKGALAKLKVSEAESPMQFVSIGHSPEIISTVVTVDKNIVQTKMAAIQNKGTSLLATVTDQKSMTKVAPEIQKLLEQWVKLENKLVAGKDGSVQTNNGDSVKTTKAESIWRDLVNAFQKRNQFVASQQYNVNAKVTSSDIAKWIGQSVAKQSSLENITINQAGQSTVPMSKVEQYVIHVNQNQSTQHAGQQLVDKFQEVMKTSKFLSLNNGTSQLSIALKPANLGDMMVKLTQLNGEMTVKIIVASAAAREMLESNMHQLKHMFSPQQVVIEKQDIQTQQLQNMQQEREQQSMKNGDQQQSEHFDQDEQKQSNDDFEKQFHEILMNEKV